MRLVRDVWVRLRVVRLRAHHTADTVTVAPATRNQLAIGSAAPRMLSAGQQAALCPSPLDASSGCRELALGEGVGLR